MRIAAAVHARLAMPRFLILEDCRHRPQFDEVQVVGPRLERGRVIPHDRLGLGINLDWDYLQKHPSQRLPLRTFTSRDSGMPLL